MRIVAGKYRSKKLYTPKNMDVRPTSERAREALFNIINSRFGADYSGFDLLDIFAGTGAFGFEGLSRGVNSVTFIDINTELVKKNASLFASEKEKIKIIQSDATNLPRASKKYNFVFSDAPYDKGLSEKALAQLGLKGWLADGALCVVEIRHSEKFLLPQNFEQLDERIYGQAKVLFLRFSDSKIN